jgi:hypothetical protein
VDVVELDVDKLLNAVGELRDFLLAAAVGCARAMAAKAASAR